MKLPTATVAHDLPRVIRPRPLLLVDLEELIATRHPFVARLEAEPAHISPLAAFVWARDPAARSRFAAPRALAAWLRRAIG
jgi:hypothetical protein